MAASVTQVIADTPHWKVFIVTVPEDDAINLDTALTYAGSGMGALAGIPGFFYADEITLPAEAPTVITTMALHGMTATAFSVFKSSVAGAAVVHRFRVFVSTKSLGQF